MALQEAMRQDWYAAARKKFCNRRAWLDIQEAGKGSDLGVVAE